MLLQKKVSVLWVMNAAAVAATATWLISIGLVFKGKTETSKVVKDLLASHEAAINRIRSRTGPGLIGPRGLPIGPRQELAATEASRVYYGTYLALLALADAEAGGTSRHFEKYSAKLPSEEALREVFAGHPGAVSWVDSNHILLTAAVQLHQAADGEIRRRGSSPREIIEQQTNLLLARHTEWLQRLEAMALEMERLEKERDELVGAVEALRREVAALREERTRLRQGQ
ncbi:MAG: hypothetical protein ACYS9X_22575 [Planctomycetota bacterium]|jgi:hypothetical protein